MLVALVWFMKGSIVVEPWAMGNGIKLLQEASHPFAGFLIGVDLAKVLGLNHAPCLAGSPKRTLFQPIEYGARTALRTSGSATMGGSPGLDGGSSSIVGGLPFGGVGGCLLLSNMFQGQ